MKKTLKKIVIAVVITVALFSAYNEYCRYDIKRMSMRIDQMIEESKCRNDSLLITVDRLIAEGNLTEDELKELLEDRKVILSASHQ